LKSKNMAIDTNEIKARLEMCHFKPIFC
jgi:hypothetical protein